MGCFLMLLASPPQTKHIRPATNILEILFEKPQKISYKFAIGFYQLRLDILETVTA